MIPDDRRMRPGQAQAASTCQTGVRATSTKARGIGPGPDTVMSALMALEVWMEEQAASIFAGTSGLLDDVPVEDVRRFESEMLDHLRRNTKILDSIRETRNLDDDTEAALREALQEFKRNFVGGAAPSVQPGHESAEAMDAEDVNQERIVRQKRG